MSQPTYQHKRHSAFTVVELLIVIVVIGVLAAVSIIAYNGIQDKAADSVVQSDLKNAGQKVAMAKVTDEVPNLYNLAYSGGSDEANRALNAIYSPSSTGYSPSERYPIVAIYEDSRWVGGLPGAAESRNLGPGYTFYALSRSGKVFVSNTWSGDTSLLSYSSSGEEEVRGFIFCAEMTLEELIDMGAETFYGMCGGYQLEHNDNVYMPAPIALAEFVLGASQSEVRDLYMNIGLSPEQADQEYASKEWLAELIVEMQSLVSHLREQIDSKEAQSAWPFRVTPGYDGYVYVERYYAEDGLWDAYGNNAIVWDSVDGVWRKPEPHLPA